MTELFDIRDTKGNTHTVELTITETSPAAPSTWNYPGHPAEWRVTGFAYISKSKLSTGRIPCDASQITDPLSRGLINAVNDALREGNEDLTSELGAHGLAYCERCDCVVFSSRIVKAEWPEQGDMCHTCADNWEPSEAQLERQAADLMGW